MKISAGDFKGRKIGAKKLFRKRDGKEDLRPTSAKVREAIFDILRSEIEGASFLDLFAGTGTVGLEALSRGAQHAVFVESVRSRAKEIESTIDKLHIGSKAELHNEPAEVYLRRASASGNKHDIIFIDPPYASEETDRILPLIDEYGILDTHGTIIMEHASRKAVPDSAGSLVLRKRYRYGDTSLALYRKEN